MRPSHNACARAPLPTRSGPLGFDSVGKIAHSRSSNLDGMPGDFAHPADPSGGWVSLCSIPPSRYGHLPDRNRTSLGAMTDSSADDLAFAEFPPATREQWLKLVDGVLKVAPFE